MARRHAMKSAAKVPVTFLTGFSPRNGALGVLGFPRGLAAKSEFCRFFTCIDGQWGASDLQYQGKAITSLVDPARNYRAWWLLGKNGEVTEITAAGRKDEQIPGAGLVSPGGRGYMEALTTIGGQLYACGYGPQVYTRIGEQWLSMADAIYTGASGSGFLAIDGTATDSIYAVGLEGEIQFFDGQRWQLVPSPTTAPLSGVRCQPNGEVWICSYDGTVMTGDVNGWQVLDGTGISDHWYSVETHEGRIYLAGDGVLAEVIGGQIVALDPVGRPVTTHRLHSQDGMLWSIGEDDILFLDQNGWSELLHPDNVE